MPSRADRSVPTTSPFTRGIVAIVLITVATVISLSFFNQAGAVGVMLNDYILSSLFGDLKYLVPAILLLIAWFIIRQSHYPDYPRHTIGAVLLLVALASLLHLSFPPKDMWNEALLGHGGGIVGMLAAPIKSYLGPLAATIILLGLTLVALILIWDNAIITVLRLPYYFLARLAALGHSLIQGARNAWREHQAPADTTNNNFALAPDETFGVAERPVFAHRPSGKVTDEEDDSDDEASSPRPSATPLWARQVIVKELPPLNLLSDKRGKPTSGDIEANAKIIQSTLREFGIDVEMGEIRVGPTVTQYSLKPNKGVKLSRITTLSNDLALALAAHPIRIEAPIPGKSLVGIEVPNQKTALVSIKELLESKEFAARPHSLMLALGKDVAGKVWVADLPRMPHLLIAGTTGSGKTVCVNTIIMGLLYQNTAETLRFIMVDPKRVELTVYNGIPHLLTPVITNVQKTVNALRWTISEMERRFIVLEESACRDIHSYNTRFPDNKMPHIVFVIDELADLMAAAASEVEAGIIRLAQMARAVGIHLIVATQRPSVDVITGLMKANIPARIAFSVASIIDSRTILDTPGAEKLLGRGDMLFLTSELSKPVRVQGAFVSEDELRQVVEYLQGDATPLYDETIAEKPGIRGTSNMFGGAADDQDPLFAESKQAILQAGKASASFLQRKLKIGYARAARILDELEAAGIIGPGEGAKPREILVTETEIFNTMDAGGELNVFQGSDETATEVDSMTDEEDKDIESKADFPSL